MAFNSFQEDSVLFSGSYDRSIRAWDLRARSRDALQVMTDFKDSVRFQDLLASRLYILTVTIWLLISSRHRSLTW